MDSSSTKPEVRVIDGWVWSATQRDLDKGRSVPFDPNEIEHGIKASLVIGDTAIPKSKVVELFEAINKGAWERIDGALRVNAVTQEHITACFKELGIELEPPF